VANRSTCPLYSNPLARLPKKKHGMNRRREKNGRKYSPKRGHLHPRIKTSRAKQRHDCTLSLWKKKEQGKKEERVTKIRGARASELARTGRRNKS